MIDVVEYKTEHESAWNEFIAGADRALIAHDLGWRTVIERGLGHKPRYFIALDRSRAVGVLPLFQVTTWWRARYLVSIPWMDYGGPCSESSEIDRALVARAGELSASLGAKFLEMRSKDKTVDDLPTADGRATFWLELDADPDKIWKGFNAKLRNQIRKPQKSGLVTEIGGIENLDDFYRVFCRNMRDLGTPVWGRDFFAAILSQFPDRANIVLVKKDGETVAGGLLLAFKDYLYVPSASSYRSALKYCPNHALYWSVIEKGCREGYRYFDFGRSGVGANTYKFKKQWVPEPATLNWQYHLTNIPEIPAINPKNPKYRLFIAAWRKSPLWLTNRLGPKLIRNFP